MSIIAAYSRSRAVCTLTGTKAGNPITGSGYVELTGYDKPKA
jgi:hypothetical protein